MTQAKFDPRTIPEGLVGALEIARTILLARFLRARYARWGANETESRRALPGDAFVPHPQSQLTLAVTVQAPMADVWRWFAQIGCRRGGWYAYDLLDNGGVPSADRILPEFQDLHVGDIVPAVPNGKFGFPVAIIEPGRVLVLAGALNTKTGATADPQNLPAEYFAGVQTFYLEHISPRTTRVNFRMRMGWNETWLNRRVYRDLMEPISFVMGRKMLQNVRRRAEGMQK